MHNTEKYEPFVFETPIEFILVGEMDGKDQVLIKSKNSNLDLVGWYQNYRSKIFEISLFRQNNSFFSLSSNKITNHIVVKWEKKTWYSNLYEKDVPKDDRISEFVFIWKGTGNASTKDLGILKEELQHRIYDVLLSIQEKNISLVEWHIAPILNLCFLISERNKRRQNLLLIVFSLYLITAFATILIWVLMHNGLYN